MALKINNAANTITMTEVGSPATPPAGTLVLYAAPDGTLHVKTDAGVNKVLADTTQVGGNNWLTANNAEDFGTTPIATGSNSIALGNDATTAATTNAVAIGSTVSAQASGVVIGHSSTGIGDSVSIGHTAITNTAGSVSIGDTTTTTGVNAVAIGNLAQATYKFGVAIGNGLSSYGGVAIGNNSDAGYISVSIGKNNTATVGSTTAIGYGNNAGTAFDVAIGRFCSTAASAGSSIAIGNNADTGGAQSIAMGINTTTAALANQVAIGTECDAGTVTSDVAYSLKMGYASANANKNLLHLYSKGKLELYGDSAQFVLPNWINAGSPAVDLPETADKGGLVYDTTADGLLVYTGSPAGWAAVGGSGAVILDAYSNLIGGTSAGGSISPTALNNIILGTSAGTTLEGGSENVFLGNSAGTNSLNGGSNICIGSIAGNHLGDSFHNIAIGAYSLGNSSAGVTGSYNISLGFNSLDNLTSGAYNIGIGEGAGANITTGAFNICIGDYAGPTGNVSNQLFIDRRATDTPLIHGTFSTTLGSPAQNGAAVTINGDLTVTGNFVGGGLASVVEDTTPQLGGNLDTNGHNIITAQATTGGSNANSITIAPGDGDAVGTGGKLPGAVTIVGGSTFGFLSAPGGAVTIQGGDAKTGEPGKVSILGGDGNHKIANGGDIDIIAGNNNYQFAVGSYTDRGGSILIQGGYPNKTISTTLGGNVTLRPGEGGTSANAGSIQIVSAGGNDYASFDIHDDVGSYKTTVKVAPLSGDTLFQLPANNGSSGYVLTTDGYGITSWASAGGGLANPLTANLDTGGYSIITANIGSPAAAADNITIQPGTSGYGYSGGNVVINAASGGGDISLVAGGYGNGVADGGNILIKSGQDSGAGGLVTIQNEGGGAKMAMDATDNITITGDIISEGSLQIGDGVGSGRGITIKTNGSYSDPFLKFRNENDFFTAQLVSDFTAKTLIIENLNPADSLSYTTLTLDTTGNVSVEQGAGGSPVTGNVPTLDSHLTRKDYVDTTAAETAMLMAVVFG